MKTTIVLVSVRFKLTEELETNRTPTYVGNLTSQVKYDHALRTCGD